MKTIWMCLVFVGMLLATSSARAAVNVYVSPIGSDSNDCSSPSTACATINAAIRRVTLTLNDTATISIDTGDIYAAPYAPDGGAPTVMDAKGTIDLDDFTIGPNGLLNIVCSTQQVNPAGLVAGAVDGGVKTIDGTHPYQGWVQIAIDGGWGDYAIDAGLAYRDGGVAVLNTNSLSDAGAYIQFTVGVDEIIAPVMANDSRVITFAFHNNNQSQITDPPDGSSKFNLVIPSSHIHSFPRDGGASSSYQQATVWLSGDAARSGTFNPGAVVNSIIDGPGINMQLMYCDVADAPLGPATNVFAAVANFSNGSVALDYDNIRGSGYGIYNTGGSLLVQASKVSNAFTNLWTFNGRAWMYGDWLLGSGSGSSAITATNNQTYIVYDNVTGPSDGSVAISQSGGGLFMTSNYLNQQAGISTAPLIATLYGTSTQVIALGWSLDGGQGLVQCGSTGALSLQTVVGPDAGSNLYSLDNGVTWTTGAGFVAVDGGTSGVHATCNQGTGCCVSSY